MKEYINIDTGAVWTEDEIRKEYEDLQHELNFDSFEDYLDDLLRQGRNREGGLLERSDYEEIFGEVVDE